jgi:hypothetical protein
MSFGGWHETNDLRVRQPIPVIDVMEGHTRLAFPLRLSKVATVLLARRLGLKENDEAIDRALVRLGVAHVERAVESGLYAIEGPDGSRQVEFDEEAITLLESLVGDKTCSYQLHEGRELFCSAAAPNDELALPVLVGHRRISPTSRAVCRGCDLPDTDYLCSHFVHPQVSGWMTTGPSMGRMLSNYLCDLGRPEINQDPHRCVAGGHECWVRTPQRISAEVLHPVPPAALAEAADFLDLAWRLVFGRPLLRLRSATDIAGLALAAETREDFEARVSDVGDLLKNFDIPDEILPSDITFPAEQTLKRLAAALKLRLSGDEHERMERAVRILTAVARVRAGTQHSDASQGLPVAFERLDLRFPPDSWHEAWDQVRSKVTATLSDLALLVRRLATGPENPTN